MSGLDLEKIKRVGAIKELKTAIRMRQHNVSHNLWGGTCTGHTFSSLGKAIARGEKELQEMRELLHALRELEPDNK